MKAKNRAAISQIFNAASPGSIRGKTVQIGMRIPKAKHDAMKEIARNEGFESVQGYLMALANADLKKRGL